MNISIGSDHAALEAKTELITFLESKGHVLTDAGTHDLKSSDYADYAAIVCKSVKLGSEERGILICGTGIGMSIAANRYAGIRAALCCTEELAILSRLHNDANIICFGARTQTIASMKSIIVPWLETEYEGGRHDRRLKKIESNSRGNHAE
ncbi:MAG: ribose 5-phosphate isomerase B [Candidatus Marinimicrobia bacterium]|nr:ribose 5-phosphate isomerase B [Candidatus Neomarinimicrobiota bacterium]